MCALIRSDIKEFNPFNFIDNPGFMYFITNFKGIFRSVFATWDVFTHEMVLVTFNFGH